MTGKPVYKPDEIRFVLDLMVQDLFNEEISLAFQERFSRELTDNQIRYLRNKYGKDPDYGSPLVNRPANKKLKRRRAALAVASSASPPSEGSPRSFKRTRRERSETLARPLYNPPKQLEAYSQSPPPKYEDKTFKSGDKAFKSEDTKSPPISSAPLFRATPPTQTQLADLRSPTVDSYTPTSAPTGFSTSSWQTQPRTIFNTNFTPINNQFHQHDTKARGQGSPDGKPTVPNQTALHNSCTQPSYDVSPNQRPSYRSQVHSNMLVPAHQQSVGVQSGL